MSFGARLAQARKDKELTQTELGKGLGTDGADASKAVVYGWEKDQHFPRVDQLALICSKLNTSADFLLFGREAESALLPDVAEVAFAINSLPERWRRWALTNIKTVIDAAQEAISLNTNSGKSVNVPASEALQEPKKRVKGG